MSPKFGLEEIGLDDLKKAQYTYGIPGQSNKFTKTTKTIAEYARIAYGKEMWTLVLEGTETTFQEPPEPKKEATSSEMVKYKMLLQRSWDDEKRYKQNKAKMFGIIMGKCHAAMKNKVETLEDFKTMEADDDVVTLLIRMKELAFSTDSNQYEYWTMQAAMRKIITMRMDPKESLVGFSKRFLAQREVTEDVWGKLIPQKMKGKRAEEQDEARDRFLACVFLAGVDRDRYKQAINDLNNDFVQGTKNYPKDVPAMMALLNNRREISGGNRKIEEIQDGYDLTSFAQTEDRRTCYRCGKKGHIAPKCPEKKKRGENEDDDSSRGSRHTSRTGWSGFQVTGRVQQPFADDVWSG